MSHKINLKLFFESTILKEFKDERWKAIIWEKKLDERLNLNDEDDEYREALGQVV